ncbi:MAG TPA: MFS transporter, partial [Flavobacteriales bacterium]|nr:MFS transporter [Flavobacteriales bacterium]
LLGRVLVGTLFPALQTIYVNMAPSSQRGTANSTYLTGFDLGISIGMLLGAWLVDQYGYTVMFLATGTLAVIGLAIYWASSRQVYERYRLDRAAEQ